MHQLDELLQSHPVVRQARGRPAKELQDCIDACFSCVQACKLCADACLSEEMVASLVRCIRLNLDAADICLATGSAVTRLTQPSNRVLAAQLGACATACAVCAEECERHARHHEHCAICAEECRVCEAACRRLLDAGPARH